jgi:hypothetical protein
VRSHRRRHTWTEEAWSRPIFIDKMEYGMTAIFSVNLTAQAWLGER